MGNNATVSAESDIGIVMSDIGTFTGIGGCIGSKMNTEGKPGLDYIIVLGAQIYERGPSAVLRFRLDKAVEYLNENPQTKCIVSGGKGSNEPCSEAEGMKNI